MSPSVSSLCCIQYSPGGGGVLPYMAYTRMCRWTVHVFLPLCPIILDRVYNFERVCPNYKQDIACTIDLIC